MWSNHVFLRKRGMFWKPTKLPHLYLFIMTWWPIFRVVIPKCTRCLYRKHQYGAQCHVVLIKMHEPCVQVLLVELPVTLVSGCHLLARIDHPTPFYAQQQGVPPVDRVVVSAKRPTEVITYLVPVTRLLHWLRPRWYSVHHITFWCRIPCDRTPRVLPT